MRRPLQLLTAITFLTWVGTRLTAVALPLVALDETGEAWTTGLVGGISSLPLLTVAWWGGSLRDRLTCGRALAVVMAVQAAGLAVVPLAALTNHLGAGALCTCGLVTGSAAALMGPAQRALVSDLADADRTVGGAPRWLAWQDLAHRTSMIFAPPAAAWLVVAWGAQPLLWCETIVVLAGAVAMLRVPASGRAPTRNEDGAGAARPTVSTIAVLRAHPRIAAGVVMAGVGGVCWFAFSLGLAILGVELGMPGRLIAAGMSGYGATSVLSSFLVPAVIGRLPRMGTMVASWAVLGLAFVALPLAAPNLLAVTLVAAAGGAAMPLGMAALNALISEETHGAERRAAFTAEAVVHSGGTSLGLLAGGAVIGWAGAGPVLVATGVVQLLTPTGCAWGLRRLHRGRRPTGPRAPRSAGTAAAATAGTGPRPDAGTSLPARPHRPRPGPAPTPRG